MVSQTRRSIPHQLSGNPSHLSVITSSIFDFVPMQVPIINKSIMSGSVVNDRRQRVNVDNYMHKLVNNEVPSHSKN